MEFQRVVEKRASFRKFSEKKPKPTEIIKLLDIANLSPSPGNREILRYIVVEDEEIKDKIAEACQQNFVRKAPYVIVVCSYPTHIRNVYDKRANRYIKQHAGAAIEHILLKAVDLGLVGCWVGAFSEVTIKTLLAIPDKIDVEAVIPIGYKLVTDKTKQRRKPRLQGRVFYDRFNNIYRKPLRSAYPF